MKLYIILVGRTVPTGSSAGKSDLEEEKRLEQNGVETGAITVSKRMIMGQGFSG